MKSNLMKFGGGFTIIELILVIATIGVFASFVYFNYPGATKGARDARRMSDLKSYQVSLEFYAGKNAGLFPQSTGPTDLTNYCSVLGISANACLDDPKGGEYLYEANVQASAYTIYASLEKSGNYYVFCSNGKSGTTASAPSGGVCPVFN